MLKPKKKITKKHLKEDKFLTTLVKLNDYLNREVGYISDALDKSKLKDDCILYRVVSSREGFFDHPEKTVGAIIKDKGFMSTSMYDLTGLNYRDKLGISVEADHVTFKFLTKKGKRAAPLFNRMGEQEVLFQKGTR